MMDRVRLGVIGCGSLGKLHVNLNFNRKDIMSADLHPFAEKLEVRGLVDIDLAKAEALRETFGGAYATDDPERLFADDKMDAVLITTWHDTHAPLSLRALASGKHVLVEKPMVMTEKECDDVVEAVERTGLKYMVAFRSRFGKGAKDVKREIPHPDNVITHARTHGIWREGMWAQDPIKGGGQILSQGCHIVDLMFFLAGAEPESVYAVGGVYHHSRPDVMDTLNAAIRFNNGSVGALIAGDGGAGRLMNHPKLAYQFPFFVMVIDKGRSALVMDHGHDARFESCVPESEWTPPYDVADYTHDLGSEAASGMADILPTFTRCILNDETPPATARDGARTTRFIRKCFESAITGKIVTF
ncbi:MAG: hypothetical protein AUJ92_12620 [Armatimonadetes bacterium CG2_30_59_28]|nr:Gfo/Idh/MocA family oxidoreductase [Armatimonadota bacterium]OIO93345.1 MAG: hypothetical protein AUJ92_12620 [Armatimonadetes bacterium CG2_30_59_28]PIU66306.1 MAG: hypothetical protein COS85_05505 [Armatimonadetes bacterium CG07_land_8_20_14_0_80_59_28]PIX43729.1 MAG: hypothetical protein COZ56_06485 [Armatimonadetes bacterium CG_4_8_14_3_um_filter_58_9]PIY48682.1 MAG: hypothetical protein COZ05_02480 [Armatimonadetes bacterium CG_4_10_14_3_um_filter_59_10]PJB72703.1 MAG: hypothetical pro